jgi:excisionase family DNA binding protein
VTGFRRLEAVAAVLGCSVKTIRRLIHDPENPLPVHRIGRKLLVVADRDLEAWLVARRVVGLASETEPDVADFLAPLLQPKCNPMKKANGNAADPLIRTPLQRRRSKRAGDRAIP